MSASPPSPAPGSWPDFRGLRVAVIGDIVADRYVYARPTRPSREAPLVVLREERMEILPGGAGNTARNVRSLGAQVQLIGCVGRDDAGCDVVGQLSAEGVDVSAVCELDGWRTPVKTRVLAGEAGRTPQQVLRLDREPEGPAPDDRRALLHERLLGLAGKVDAVIISDYGYGLCDGALGATMAEFQRRSSAPVVLDPRQSMMSLGPVTAMTPNREDLARAVGLSGAQLDDSKVLEGVAQEVLGSAQLELLLVTLGKGGMALFGSDLPSCGVRLPAFGPQAVVDVTGAGDTAAAAFCLGLAAGIGGPAAMVLANAAAGVVVMKLGADVCTRRELDAALIDLPGSAAALLGHVSEARDLV